jgi:hypothetical protein
VFVGVEGTGSGGDGEVGTEERTTPLRDRGRSGAEEDVDVDADVLGNEAGVELDRKRFSIGCKMKKRILISFNLLNWKKGGDKESYPSCSSLGAIFPPSL